MDIIQLDRHSKIPVYSQIVRCVRAAVASGKLAPNSPMPSVRKLAADLGVNPNTVQKAYTFLMRGGVIYSIAGRGNFVADSAGLLRSEQRERVLAELRRLTLEAKDSGIWIDELLTTVDDAYSGGD